MQIVEDELLRMIVCPLSKADLVCHGDLLVSTDRFSRRSYQIQFGIPDLLVSHSRELEMHEWEQVMIATKHA